MSDADPLPALPSFTPVPRQRMRRGGWSAERQRQFIELLAQTGSVRAACRRMGVGEHHIYKLRNHPEAAGFRKAWEAALDLGIARIEDVAMDRALNGVEEPVYHRGELVGTRRVYNDRLLMFLLRNRAADRFGVGVDSGVRQGRGSDAVPAKELARLKREWRAECRREWEAERAAAARTDNGESEDAVIRSINEKLTKMRDRHLLAMSPRTRAAYEEYRRCEAEDEEAGYRYWEDPDHEAYRDVSASCDDDEEAGALPPPGWGERKVEAVEEEENLRWLGIKDEGWG